MFKLSKSTRAYAPAIMGVIAVIGVVVGILVGLIVTGQLATTANQYNLGVTGNTTRTSIITTAYQSYQLGTVLPVVIFAGIIIGAISAWMYVRESGV